MARFSTPQRALAATALVLLVAVALAPQPAAGLKHHLDLKGESRRFFIISSFGLLEMGHIRVATKKYAAHTPIDNIGITLHRSSEAAAEYQLSQAALDGCIFANSSAQLPHTIRVRMDKNGYFLPPMDTLPGVNVDELPSKATVSKISFSVDSSAEDEYTVAFHICSSIEPSIDIMIHMDEANAGPDYLGAGLSPLPTIYGVMAACFAIAAAAWGRLLYDHRKSPFLFKIHYLMLAVVSIKVFSLTFHAVDYHYVKVQGTPNESWAWVYYILHFAKGILLFLVILLIGAGYGFVKHVLSDNEKKLFAVVLTLQVIANIANIVLAETSEGSRLHSTWQSINLLVDLMCCAAILFPVIWSIKHLREASEIDGKAQANLQRLRLFRKYYVMVLGYVYVTRIIIYLMEISLPFRYTWIGPFLVELATLAFYVITGFMFKPGSTNEYMRLSVNDSDDEDSMEMQQLVSQTGMSDGVRQTRRAANASAAQQSQRRERSAQQAAERKEAEEREERDALDAAYEVLNLADE